MFLHNSKHITEHITSVSDNVLYNYDMILSKVGHLS